MAHETQPGDGRTDAELLAHKIYEWLSGIKHGDESILHAAVTCDFAGSENFKRSLAKLIGEYLSGTRPDEVAELRAANATLSARVAELEALVKVLREGGRPIGDRPFTIAPDGQDHKYWSGTTDLGATFSKPAPGAEGGE